MRKKGHQSKLMKIITLPLRLLKKGRDFYVRSMVNISEKPIYGGSYMSGSVNYGSRTVSGSGLPKSFSTSVTHTWSSNLEGGDARDLIRANSTALNSNDVEYDKLRAEMDMYLKQLIKEKRIKELEKILGSEVRLDEGSSNGVVPRSVSVGMAKIEEEEEEEEEGSFDIKKKSEVMFPRSKSEAVTQTSSAVF